MCICVLYIYIFIRDIVVFLICKKIFIFIICIYEFLYIYTTGIKLCMATSLVGSGSELFLGCTNGGFPLECYSGRRRQI